MKIKGNTLEQILNDMPLSPPEAGGIIGGKNGVVCAWEADRNDESAGCVYRPNVIYLNQVIKAWEGNGIVFMGIVHVHFGNAKTLSQGDILYINQIMHAMPKSHKKLFFPIVIQPENAFCVYVAQRDVAGVVKIEKESFTIID